MPRESRTCCPGLFGHRESITVLPSDLPAVKLPASAAPPSHSQAAHLLSARAKPSVVVRRGWQEAGSSRRAAGGGSRHCKPRAGLSSPAAETAAASPNLCPARRFAAAVGVSAHRRQLTTADATSRKLRNSRFHIRMSCSMQLDPASSLIF